MKKRLLILLVTVALLTTACGKEQVYYEFGMPTKDSTTNYEELVEKTGLSTFVKSENGELSVCIYRDEKLDCFKSINSSDDEEGFWEELKHLENVFGADKCMAAGGEFYCDDEFYNCSISTNGRILCTVYEMTGPESNRSCELFGGGNYVNCH